MNRSKQKGTRFESEVRDYLIENGFPTVERRTLHGSQDRGDLANVPDWTLELKATQSIDLAGAMDEARVEAANAKTPWFAAIIKRRRKSTGEAYAVMPLSQLTALIRAIQYRKEI